MGAKRDGKETKTNAMRILDGKKLPYACHDYGGEKLDAVSVSKIVNRDPACVLKTLVAKGRSGGHYVFILPGDGALDLKKAAKLTGEKSIEMLPQKELLPLTGYVAGGCSPIGMKKQLPTFLEEAATAHEFVLVSAGRIGSQIELRPGDLMQAVPITAGPLCVEEA